MNRKTLMIRVVILLLAALALAEGLWMARPAPPAAPANAAATNTQ